ERERSHAPHPSPVSGRVVCAANRGGTPARRNPTQPSRSSGHPPRNRGGQSSLSRLMLALALAAGLFASSNHARAKMQEILQFDTGDPMEGGTRAQFVEFVAAQVGRIVGVKGGIPQVSCPIVTQEKPRVAEIGSDGPGGLFCPVPME